MVFSHSKGKNTFSLSDSIHASEHDFAVEKEPAHRFEVNSHSLLYVIQLKFPSRSHWNPHTSQTKSLYSTQSTKPIYTTIYATVLLASKDFSWILPLPYVYLSILYSNPVWSLGVAEWTRTLSPPSPQTPPTYLRLLSSSVSIRRQTNSSSCSRYFAKLRVQRVFYVRHNFWKTLSRQGLKDFFRCINLLMGPTAERFAWNFPC